MSELHLDEHQTRITKLEQLHQAGIAWYVTKFPRTHTIDELKELVNNYTLPDAELVMQEGAASSYSIAWRLMLFRTMGKLSFGKLRDASGDIQIAFVKNLCSLYTWKQLVQSVQIADKEVSAYKFVEKYLDVGDFVWVKGELFVTQHGELTLFVNEFQLLTKTLRPLGDKWHWIEDIETRLRKRYLDTTMNPETKAMLERRSKFWQSMRTFLLNKWFIEVETPILEVTTGGADANPFATHHNALDIDVFLRISCGELWQKRLLVGGFEKTFEIGRIFRNEGMSPEHAQDYTQMENYRAFADYRDMMSLIKDMYLHIVDKVYNKRVFEIRGYTVDFNKSRKEIDYTSIILEKTGIDIWLASEKEIETKLDELNVSYEPQNRNRLIDTLWKFCRKQISGPAFLMNVPKFMSPLAKSNPAAPHLTERFQIVIAGSEVGNGFSELNDPLDQKARFVEQQAMRDAGDDEAQMADREYVEALEHGMPPAAWFGVSERLFCFLENLPIREAQYFPLMRPEHTEEQPMKKESHEATPKSSSLSVSAIPENLPWADQAIQLIDSYLTDTKRHCLQVGEIMRAFAKELWQDEHYRWLAGALHDIDRDHIAKDADRHLKNEFETIMDSIDAPQALRDDIKSHGDRLTWVPVDSLIRKYLSSVDELSGFLFAYSLMRPTWFDGMEVKWAMKRIKDKTFASGVDRTHLRNCETHLGIPLEEFITKMIAIMQDLR
jgi:lysyl-tRNA synthetase class 2